MQAELPSYSVIEAGGATMRTFRCEAHEAVLTDKGCAGRFVRAQGAHRRQNGRVTAAGGPTGGVGSAEALEARAESRLSMDACQRCPIGALHAGVELITRSRHYGSDQCPRCGFGTERMIAGRVCVNCYNREREVLAGRNGRGNAPKRLAPIHALALRLVVDNGPPAILADTGVSAVELMCRQLRTASGAVTFAARRRDLATQGRLFG